MGQKPLFIGDTDPFKLGHWHFLYSYIELSLRYFQQVCSHCWYFRLICANRMLEIQGFVIVFMKLRPSLDGRERTLRRKIQSCPPNWELCTAVLEIVVTPVLEVVWTWASSILFDEKAKEDLEFFIKKCYGKSRDALEWSVMVKDTNDCQGILKNGKEWQGMLRHVIECYWLLRNGIDC